MKRNSSSDIEYHSLKGRGWRSWTTIDGVTLLLCPEDDFENVDDGTEMVSINGDRAIKGRDDVDDDICFGLLAYGVVVRKPNE